MAFTPFTLSKSWLDPEDYPTVEPSEEQVRIDIQSLFTELANGLNSLITQFNNGNAVSNFKINPPAGVSGTTVQAVINSLAALIAATYTKTQSDSKYASTMTLNASTGVLTLKAADGTTLKSIDTALEKVVTNFRYDAPTQSLVLTLPDGTTQSISLSSFITELEFQNSNSITFEVVDHKVTARVTEGFIPELEEAVAVAQAAASNASTYATNAQTYAGNASTYATNASNYAKNAKSWAVGGTSSRTGEDTNNSSYFAGRASTYATNANTYATNANSYATLAQSYAKGGTGTRSGENTDNAKYYMNQTASKLSAYMKTTDIQATYATIATLNNYLKTATAASTYLKKTDASSTYLSKSDANTSYLKKTDASATYALITSLASYLTTTTAASTYLKQTDASSTYAKKSEYVANSRITISTSAPTGGSNGDLWFKVVG